MLAVTGVLAAYVSDLFVSALQPAIDSLHISQTFAGLVVVAIAGNAVENAVGVKLALQNQADHALSVILNSPLQIALVLAPALVLGGWGLRRGLLARLLAVAGVLTAPVALVAASWDEVQRTLTPYPDPVSLAVLGLGGAALAGALAWGGSLALGPWTPRGVRP